ncbi:hypothetical protein AJ85_12760 [Alkalihalobacillus alcalophilus ATCC 27647 = CGMCC 1.3604]|uniref:Uncharacterized protein n=1 Tax=Alkalihalobacillus alcalophilus ATCC 27647 = CGMCC 1.3604 TaxID=1218173 RepID=A0A4S4JZA3_ALKAL|nr:hypothetical protein AJ85_12760 [Alkalihalobacillus alcalophilus ATCC 27647 = CGMCC 1.3604]
MKLVNWADYGAKKDFSNFDVAEKVITAAV